MHRHSSNMMSASLNSSLVAPKEHFKQNASQILSKNLASELPQQKTKSNTRNDSKSKTIHSIVL